MGWRVGRKWEGGRVGGTDRAVIGRENNRAVVGREGWEEGYRVSIAGCRTGLVLALDTVD